MAVKKISLLSGVLIISLFLKGYYSGVENYSQEEAFKVLALIEKIQSELAIPYSGKLREVEITESELNSYIAHRIVTEREEIMKDLRLKIFDDNKIEGKIYFDLRGQNFPKLLRPEMTFYFEGILNVKKGQAQLKIKELFLEQQRIEPALLDLAMYIAAKLSNTESSSINDWYFLPFGIKDIRTYKGRATFYY